jgi:2-phosphoglycerate kinase
MTEARFQAICTTRYIIRKLLPFSHVECPEFRATVHAAWKVIKAETQRNLVAEMYLLMVAGIKKKLAAVIATALQGHDGSCVVLGQPCVCGARLLGSHGSAVSAIVAGVD